MSIKNIERKIKDKIIKIIAALSPYNITARKYIVIKNIINGFFNNFILKKKKENKKKGNSLDKYDPNFKSVLKIPVTLSYSF